MIFFTLAARLILSGPMLIAGIAKMGDSAGLRQALVDFGLPLKTVTPIAWLLPISELLVGAVLLSGLSTWWGTLSALGLLFVFTIAISINLLQGRRPKCHCFGKLDSAPIGPSSIVRNGLLGLAAGFLLCGCQMGLLQKIFNGFYRI